MSREDYYNNLKAERGRGPWRGERHAEAGREAHGHHHEHGRQEHGRHEHGQQEHGRHEHDQQEHGHHDHGWGRGPFAGHT